MPIPAYECPLWLRQACTRLSARTIRVTEPVLADDEYSEEDDRRPTPTLGATCPR